MTEPAENYIPNDIAREMKRQAVRVWAIGLAVAGFWALLIVLTPVFRANGLTSVSEPLYHFFRYLCHQMPERSFHIAGEQFAVCSRCFGVYFGIIAGFLAYPLFRNITDIGPIPRYWLFLSLIPVSVDWSLTALGIWENTHLSRFVTGLILGFACAVFIVPAIVEIRRNLTYRRRGPRPGV